MKTVIQIICLPLIFLFASDSLSAQQEKKKVETTEFQVTGVCKMCKKRIENAALIKGVKWAEWTKETNTFKVVYKTQNVTVEEIHQAIAQSGHDTDMVKADEKSYKKLPKCCRYRDGVKIH